MRLKTQLSKNLQAFILTISLSSHAFGQVMTPQQILQNRMNQVALPTPAPTPKFNWVDANQTCLWGTSNTSMATSGDLSSLEQMTRDLKSLGADESELEAIFKEAGCNPEVIQDWAPQDQRPLFEQIHHSNQIEFQGIDFKTADLNLQRQNSCKSWEKLNDGQGCQRLRDLETELNSPEGLAKYKKIRSSLNIDETQFTQRGGRAGYIIDIVGVVIDLIAEFREDAREEEKLKLARQNQESKNPSPTRDCNSSTDTRPTSPETRPDSANPKTQNEEAKNQDKTYSENKETESKQNKTEEHQDKNKDGEKNQDQAKTEKAVKDQPSNTQKKKQEEESLVTDEQLQQEFEFLKKELRKEIEKCDQSRSSSQPFHQRKPSERAPYINVQNESNEPACDTSKLSIKLESKRSEVAKCDNKVVHCSTEIKIKALELKTMKFNRDFDDFQRSGCDSMILNSRSSAPGRCLELEKKLFGNKEIKLPNFNAPKEKGKTP